MPAFLKRHALSILVLLAMAGVWQILSIVFTAEAVPGEPMVPGWQVVLTRTFLSLADYWEGGLGVPSVAEGAPPSYLAALLAILSHSLDTMVRLYAGLLVGGVIGTALGLAVSWSRWSRRLVDLPVQIIRTLPLLAMVPLFQLWFGTYFVGKVIFVAYGVGVIFFAGTVNAVRNVPQIYIDNARTLGASRLRLYRTVILPAIFPELRATILLSLGTAWAAVLGAEYLGAQSGLGYIIVYSEQFAYLDRMFIVALLFVIYASISYALFDRLCLRLLRWTPRAGRDVIVG
ncbi:MAG TPA: ABC transporter permease subunit [Geminicoccaceae bacterium]|jgi:ABC-type nitrate/sulfonate/bicarbonate transport system permease component|nr:ABC transporter permease subunit [Geminicoccaceae bacterium]